MEFVFGWLVFSVVAGAVASSKGRSGVFYFLLSLVLSPLIGLILAALMPRVESGRDKPHPNTHVKCPDCREFVLKDANVCKHCGCRLVPQ